MKNIIRRSLKKYFSLRIFKYQSWKKNALLTQEMILDDLIESSQHTEFGKKYSFCELYAYETFSEMLPLSDYESIKGDIDRMVQGTCDVLCPGKVNFFAKSSGTTADKSKFIPVSHTTLYKNNYEAGRDLYSIVFDLYPDISIFDDKGSVLGLGGNFSTHSSGALIGDVSTFIMSQLPAWAEKYREPSLDVALIEKWKEKLPAIAEDIKGKNITHIAGVPTWYVSLFKNIIEKEKLDNIHQRYPNLELFIHGAVSFDPYREMFNKIIGHPEMKYLEAYNATEGFFALQDTKNQKDGMLLLTNHAIYYEFIPMSVFGTKDQYVINLSSVKVGVNYALVITTASGLWRYSIGDTIEFVSVDPYRIKITGRTKHFINVFGEELMVGDTEKAIAAISKEHGCQILHYTVAPIFMDTSGKGGHEWLIEWENKPKNMSQFAIDLDKALSGINSDYAAKRQNNIALQLPVINIARAGQFDDWLESKGKLGGQSKVPRLSNSRKTLEEIQNIRDKKTA